MAHNQNAPKGWHSRGYLPHFDGVSLIQSVTFRLADSVPSEVVDAWKRELCWEDTFHAESPEARELRQRIAAYEDSGHGECHLRRREIASLVQDALLHFDGERYRLHVWCVMPNHVHVLVSTGVLPGSAGILPARDANGAQDARAPGFRSLGNIVHSWKSYTALQANRILGRHDVPFWQPDFFDRFIRDENHFHAAVAYIHDNPVKARLCARPEDWPWSSAHPGARASCPHGLHPDNGAQDASAPGI